MSARIIELLKQSGAYDYYEINEGVNGDDQPMMRFAELIVKECAGFTQYYYTRNECVSPEQIRQHFGITE